MSDSEPLTTLIASGPMPIEEVMRIGRGAAAALPSVHGELWPSAITVSAESVGILPPGLADRSRYGQYSAPERILGKPATPQSDVFSLGAILFHALTGRPPFRGDTPTEVMLAACADTPLDVRSYRTDVPVELVNVIVRSLSRDPASAMTRPRCFAMRSIVSARATHFRASAFSSPTTMRRCATSTNRSRR